MPSMGTHLGHTLPLSLDDLTRPSQERPRNRQAERLGIVGGVPSDDDSREQRIVVHSPRRLLEPAEEHLDLLPGLQVTHPRRDLEPCWYATRASAIWPARSSARPSL